jgi:hypothetical protein
MECDPVIRPAVFGSFPFTFLLTALARQPFHCPMCLGCPRRHPHPVIPTRPSVLQSILPRPSIASDAISAERSTSDSSPLIFPWLSVSHYQLCTLGSCILGLAQTHPASMVSLAHSLCPWPCSDTSHIHGLGSTQLASWLFKPLRVSWTSIRLQRTHSPTLLHYTAFISHYHAIFIQVSYPLTFLNISSTAACDQCRLQAKLSCSFPMHLN